MNKYFIYFALTLIPLALGACGGGKKGKAGRPAADSLTATEEINAATAAADSVFSLTVDSIGPVRVGEPISSLPVTVEGLYDNVLLTETPDAVAYTFLLRDIPQFTVFDFLDGKVDLIALEGDSRGVATPVGELKIGAPFTELLALDGVTAEWEAIDDSGIWYWRYRGLFFGIEETNISDSLADAISDNHNPPSAALFTPDVKIGYIATGLPF